MWAASRLIIGVALAGSYIASMTLLANFFPPHIRGRLLSVNMSMFSLALLMAGGIGIATGGANWRVFLVLAAVLPVVVTLLTLAFVPRDGRYAVYGNSEVISAPPSTAGVWRDMLIGSRGVITACCIVLAGLNFCGYQFYSGFITTYLFSERHFDAAVIGWFVLVDGIGTLSGSLLWGTIADRYGRRVNAIGFGCTTIFIALFLTVPAMKPLLLLIEFGYAVCLSATNCWAAYFAELFPVRLRPMGSALYHGGHLISLAAPFVVTLVAHLHSLTLGMALAPVSFDAAAILWWFLPETLRSSRLYRGFDAERPSLKA
jgi:MFS family permease